MILGLMIRQPLLCPAIFIDVCCLLSTSLSHWDEAQAVAYLCHCVLVSFVSAHKVDAALATPIIHGFLFHEGLVLGVTDQREERGQLEAFIARVLGDKVCEHLCLLTAPVSWSDVESFFSRPDRTATLNLKTAFCSSPVRAHS